MKTAEDILKDKQRGMITISHDQTVLQACRKMVDHKIGVIVVTKDDEIVGVFSERDLLQHVIDEGFNLKTSKVGDYMSTLLHSVSYSAKIHKLEEMFLGLFVRHLLVEQDSDYIGLLSIGDVLRASLLEKDQQFKELNALVSWEYYENWKWGRKKKGDPVFSVLCFVFVVRQQRITSNIFSGSDTVYRL